MSHKIYNARSQADLAQHWFNGNNARYKDIILKDGVITARAKVWKEDFHYDPVSFVLAYVDSTGERIVYNYTGSDMADAYLRAQQPRKWNGGYPRFPDLLYAQIGKGKAVNGSVTSNLVHKLIEVGQATKILLPPEKGHPHWAGI